MTHHGIAHKGQEIDSLRIDTGGLYQLTHNSIYGPADEFFHSQKTVRLLHRMRYARYDVGAIDALAVISGNGTDDPAT